MKPIRQKILAIALSTFVLPLSFAQGASTSTEVIKSVDSGKAKDNGHTDQMLYQYLISEIAGQRGRTGLAMRGMVDLAQRTRDPRVARRAVEIAFQARQMDAALEATSLWLELEPDSSVARQALAAITGNQGTLESTKMNLGKLLASPTEPPAY